MTGQQELVLVPRIPTKEMLEAAWADALAEDAAGVWAAMLAAYQTSSTAQEIRTTVGVGFHVSETPKICS